MPRRYGAYLLRCWGLESAAQRVEIEHVQSGVRTVCPSLAAAAEWIGRHAGALAGTPASQDGAREPAERQGKKGLTGDMHAPGRYLEREITAGEGGEGGHDG